MSTTGEQTPASSPGAGDDTQRLTPPSSREGAMSAMRDGAMARTAPRRDLAGAAARARATTRGPGSTTSEPRYAAPSSDGGSGMARTAAAVGAGAAAGTSPAGAPAAAREGGTARTARTRTGRGGAARAPRRTGPRRVRLTVQRIDPWSVMKISFLVSVALGIAGVVAIAVLWTVLSGMDVFSTINDLYVQLTTGESGATGTSIMEWLGFGRVMSLAVVIGVVNVILLTAIATLSAFLYNICTALVGGAQLTLADE